MKAVISADELAKDVAGAEALLESHQEHKVFTIYNCIYNLFFLFIVFLDECIKVQFNFCFEILVDLARI